MKYVIPAIAMIALLGFVGFTGAVDTPKPKTHTHKGTFVKVDKDELTYKGLKTPFKEHQIKIDEMKTKVTLDEKDAKLADLKADYYLTITDEGGLATAIAALNKAPPPKAK